MLYKYFMKQSVQIHGCESNILPHIPMRKITCGLNAILTRLLTKETFLHVTNEFISS